MTRCLHCRQLYPGSHCQRCFPKGKSRGWAWNKVRTQILIRDSFTCVICRRRCSHMGHDFPKGVAQCAEMHVDHIQPRASGGTDHPTNLRTTHASYNQRGVCS